MTKNIQDQNPKKFSTEKFYSDIRKEYSRLSNFKKDGIKVYSEEYILNEVAQKFYRSPRTIVNIVYYRL